MHFKYYITWRRRLQYNVKKLCRKFYLFADKNLNGGTAAKHVSEQAMCSEFVQTKINWLFPEKAQTLFKNMLNKKSAHLLTEDEREMISLSGDKRALTVRW